MKSVILGAALALALAAPAIAQDAAAPVTTAPAAPADAAAKFSLDTPIETLVADPAAKAVLDKDLGMDVSQHPAYEMFKTASLTQVAPQSNGMLTPEVLAKVSADLAAIK